MQVKSECIYDLTSREKILKDDVSNIFDRQRFQTPRLPVGAGHIKDTSCIADLPSCLDMLIKLPNGQIILPEPYRSSSAIKDIISQAISFEGELLSRWRQTRYLYLTVDTRDVIAGETHRNAGWHFDGMQGNRYPEKLPACHQYITTYGEPTEYCGLPFDADRLDENKDNWFECLENQIPPDYMAWTPAPGDLVCMSAYQMHRSPIVEQGHKRSMVRLDVSCKQQDRLGNSLNPDLPAPFTYQVRKLPEGLGRPISDASWKGKVRFGEARIPS